MTYARGEDHPFQPVIYVTKAIYEQLEWSKLELKDLYHFDKVLTSLGDQAILTLLGLNLNTEDNPRYIHERGPYLPNAIGTATLLHLWQEDLHDHEDRKLAYEKILTELSLLSHYPAIAKAFTVEETDINLSYQVIHDPKSIFVILDSYAVTTDTKNLSQEESNLLYTKFHALATEITRSVIETYSLYFTHDRVAQSPWFFHYVDQL
nr:MAG TPA: hypothetical protein [Caudoviricetes sp.]